MPKTSLLVRVASALSAALLAGCYTVANPGASGTAPPGGPLAGKPSPSFVVKRLGSGSGSLASFRGRYVVANLWATWCPPCRHEMPALQRLSRTYASRNLVVVGIDQGEEERVVEHYIRSVGTTYPILLDQDQRYGEAFAVVGLPTSVFIAADGTVMMQIDGEMSYRRMVTLTDLLLRASP